MTKTLIKQDVLASSEAKFLNNDSLQALYKQLWDTWIYFPRLL